MTIYRDDLWSTRYHESAHATALWFAGDGEHLCSMDTLRQQESLYVSLGGIVSSGVLKRPDRVKAFISLSGAFAEAHLRRDERGWFEAFLRLRGGDTESVHALALTAAEVKEISGWVEEAFDHARVWAATKALATLLSHFPKVNGEHAVGVLHASWGDQTPFPYRQLGRAWVRRFERGFIINS